MKKAYIIHDDNEGYGTIAFHQHRIVAFINGIRQLGGDADEMSYYSCRRAANLDKYAEKGEVPASVLIEYGWYIECVGCGETIDDDLLYDNNLTTDDVQGTLWDAYCSKECEDSFKTQKQQEHLAKNRALTRAKAALMRRLTPTQYKQIEFDDTKLWSAVEMDHKDGVICVTKTKLYFRFPGSTGNSAHIELDESGRVTFYVSQLNLDAYNAWDGPRSDGKDNNS
jgi:hypothetical protein